MFQIGTMIVWGAIIVITVTVVLFLYHTLYVKTTIVPMNVPAAPPLILVHLSDIHGRTRFLNGPLHRLVNRWKPDIVCVTGDLAQQQQQLTGVLEEIGKLEARCGIYFWPQHLGLRF